MTAAARWPDDAASWNNLGISYIKLGRHADAIEAYRQALRIWPDYADAWGHLAVAYELSGNRMAALRYASTEAMDS